MGRQVLLYLTPTDLIDLEATIMSIENVVFLSYQSKKPEPNYLDSLVISEMGKSWLSLYFARSEDIQLLSYLEVSKQSYWTVDMLVSPVIEFSRCYFDEAILRRGRLFYQTGFYNDEGAWIEKPKEFLVWASKVFRVVKAGLEFDKSLSAYVGKDALQWKHSKSGKFVDR